jgi:MbtH protein
MSDQQAGPTSVYKVVVNHEGQYSIWPADRDNPFGWDDSGKVGSKEDCLASIEEVWTDMRPVSVRKQMEQTNSCQPE